MRHFDASHHFQGQYDRDITDVSLLHITRDCACQLTIIRFQLYYNTGQYCYFCDETFRILISFNNQMRTECKFWKFISYGESLFIRIFMPDINSIANVQNRSLMGAEQESCGSKNNDLGIVMADTLIYRVL